MKEWNASTVLPISVQYTEGRKEGRKEERNQRLKGRGNFCPHLKAKERKGRHEKEGRKEGRKEGELKGVGN